MTLVPTDSDYSKISRGVVKFAKYIFPDVHKASTIVRTLAQMLAGLLQ